MKLLLPMILILAGTFVNAQTHDSLPKRHLPPVRYTMRSFERTDNSIQTDAVRLNLFGDYVITGYAVLGSKSPSNHELDMLIGTAVKFQNTSVTGTNIDPISFEIYQVEKQNRDDYVYRVFGNVSAQIDPVKIPESFNVHKTDNENCYGIIELRMNEIAIPYKGVLLYLKRANS